MTSVNCEGRYLAEGLLHNLSPCFDIVFEPLGVITRTNKKIVEIVSASEFYLIINPLKKNKESKKQLFRLYLPVKLAQGKMSMKKEKNSSNIIYIIISFSKIAGKTELFFGKNRLNVNLERNI